MSGTVHLAVLTTRMAGSNTFLIRDLRSLLRRGIKIDLYLFSSHGLDAGFRSELEDAGGSVQAVPFSWQWRLPGVLLRELVKRPALLLQSMRIALSTCLASPPEGIRAAAVFPASVLLGGTIARSGATQVHALWAGVPATVAFWIERHSGLPYSFSAHAWDLMEHRKLLRQKTQAARGVIVCSEFARRTLASTADESSMARVKIVHHGLDLAEWKFSTRSKPSTSAEILAVGRLTAKKGFRDLIHACGELKRMGIVFRCSIIGPDGGQRRFLNSIISSLGLEQHVQLPGQVDARGVRARVAQAHVLVCPSIETSRSSDGIPNVILEALASGTPVVSTDAGGIPEVVRAGETGWLAPQSDPARLAGVIAHALRDWTASLQMALAGRALVEREFDSDHNATAYLRAIGIAPF